MDPARRIPDHLSLADRRLTIRAAKLRVGIVLVGVLLALGVYLYRVAIG